MSNSKISSLLNKIKNDGKTRFLLIAVCVFLLVAIVGINIFSAKTESTVSNDRVGEYVYGLERKLENLLCKVDGAGKVSVAISVESGMETVLAMTTTTKESSSGKETVSTPVLVNGKTVVLKEMYPKINGVLIVAEGAGKISVYNRIQQAALSLLDVKPAEIEILTMK